MLKKILVAEDEKPLLTSLTNKLKKAGYKVITAVNGEEVLEKFQKENPDLLLLDLVMPKKNGFDVLKEIKYKIKSKIPIIVMSNLDQKQYIEASKHLGVTEYLVKSNISLKDLLIKVNSILS